MDNEIKCTSCEKMYEADTIIIVATEPFCIGCAERE